MACRICQPSEKGNMEKYCESCKKVIKEEMTPGMRRIIEALLYRLESAQGAVRELDDRTQGLIQY